MARRRAPVTKYIAVVEEDGLVSLDGLGSSANLLRLRQQARTEIAEGKYAGFIIKFAVGLLSRLPSHETCVSQKDCEQELTLCALRSAETYDGRVKFSTWLYNNLLMLCRNAVKTAYYEKRTPPGARIEFDPEKNLTIENYLVDYRSDEKHHAEIASLVLGMSDESQNTFYGILKCACRDRVIRDIGKRGWSKKFSFKRIRRMRRELEQLGANFKV